MRRRTSLTAATLTPLAALITPAARHQLTGDNPRAIPAVRALIRTFFDRTL